MSFRRRAVKGNNMSEEEALQKLEFKDKYNSVEDCIKDIKSKDDAFKAIKCIGVGYVKEGDISGMSSELSDFIVKIKSRKEPKFKELRKSLKKIIEMLDKVVKESGDVKDNLRIAFSILAYYRSKKNVDKYLEGDSDISKDSRKVVKLKDRLSKFKEHLEIAYKLANESADEKTKDKAININNMIKVADEIIKSLNEGFTEMTIAKIRELGKVLPSWAAGTAEAKHGVECMCDFVTLLVRRSDLKSEDSQLILNGIKRLTGYEGVLRAPGGFASFSGTSMTAAPKGEDARLSALRKSHRAIREGLLGIVKSLNDKKSDADKKFDPVVESLTDLCDKLKSSVAAAGRDIKSESTEILSLYNEFVKKLKKAGGDLATTIVEYFEYIPAGLKKVLDKL